MRYDSAKHGCPLGIIKPIYNPLHTVFIVFAIEFIDTTEKITANTTVNAVLKRDILNRYEAFSSLSHFSSLNLLYQQPLLK